MNVSLPDQMREWVNASVTSGKYANASDYVRDLIRKDRERDTSLELLQSMISDGITSGVSDKSIDDVWHDVSKRRSVE